MCDRRKIAVISDSQRSNQKRMNRTINRQSQLFLKYSREIPEAGGTSGNIYSRNLVTIEKFLSDGSHFFYSSFDHRENFIFL